jgi:hypothetical protein
LNALETETLAAVRALPADADARRALSGNVAQRLNAANRIIADLTRACAAAVIAPRSPDPRGDYLARVEAARGPTARSAGA